VRHHRLRRFFQRPRICRSCCCAGGAAGFDRETGFDAQGNPAATPARKNLFSWTLSCGSHLRFPTAVEDIR
jgi:hypothetical protein